MLVSFIPTILLLKYQLSFNAPRFYTQPFQKSIIPLPVFSFEIFQQLCPVMDEHTKTTAVTHIPPEFCQMKVQIAYSVGQQSN